jgi:hypothetical protein
LSDHLTNTQIEDYGRCLLPAREALSASDHLASCEMCRQRLESSANDDEEYLSLRAELLGEAEALTSPIAHLTVEELTEFVDGTLSGEELQVVEDHLTCCEECILMVKDLLAFKDQVTPGFDHNHHPSGHRARDESRWGQLFAALPPLWPNSLVFGSALAALILAAVGLLVWREWIGAKPEITMATPTPGVTPPASTNPTEPPLLVRLNDGDGLLAMNRDGRLTGGEHLPVAYRQIVEKALTTQRIERSSLLSELTGLENRSRGRGRRGEGFSVIEPVGKVMISDRPTFRWSQMDGATSYIVEIYNEKLERVAISPPITDRSWTVSESLKRDEIYAWQVKAFKDGRDFVSPSPPAPQARFRVLDQAMAGELSRARRNYASSHLTLGLLYARAGMIDEAVRELRALQRANPNSEIADRLLRQVLKMQSP